MERNLKIDALKGFAIILVVLGHSIQRNIITYNDNSLFKLIYSFHMPLFIFLSGYIIFGRVETSWNWFKKKFLRLILPFFSWYIIYYFLEKYSFTGLRPFLDMSRNFFAYILKGITRPENGLWYLWALFLFYCFLLLVKKMEKIFSEEFSLFLVFISINLVPYEKFGLVSLKWLFAFFSLGYLVSKYKSQLNTHKKSIELASLLIFPILGTILVKTELWPIRDLSIWPNLSFLFTHFDFLIFRYVIAICGIVFSFSIINILFNISPKKAQYILSTLGMFSLDIYVTHLLFLRIGIGQEWLKAFSACLVSILLSFFICRFILRKSKILNFLLFGEKITKGSSF